MNNQFFSIRRFALFIMAFSLVFSIYACGAGESEADSYWLGGEEAPAIELTEYPGDAVEAPAEEEPAEEAPPEPEDGSDAGSIPVTGGGNSGNSGGGNANYPTPPASDSTQIVIVQSSVVVSPTPEHDAGNNNGIDTVGIGGGGFVELPSYISEQRRLTLEYPPRMKAGVESDLVTLTLEMDDQGNITPTAEFQGNSVQSDVVSVPDVYDTHYVTAEAQFDMAGMTIIPSGAILEPLLPGQKLTFTWSILPQDTGRYKGKVWLHLNFVDKANGDKSRKTISGQVIEIEAVDFFGLSVNFTRTSGVVGSVVGTVLGIPFFDEIVKFLFKRRRKVRR